MLLLTATPEQLGVESHFARLRLLDPDRFHDLEQFRKESAGYEPLAKAVQQLLEAGQLPEEQAAVIASLVGEEAQPLLDSLTAEDREQEAYDQAKEQLIRLLLDRHGTGRILFRNTRASVPGFPGSRRAGLSTTPCRSFTRLHWKNPGNPGICSSTSCFRSCPTRPTSRLMTWIPGGKLTPGSNGWRIS